MAGENLKKVVDKQGRVFERGTGFMRVPKVVVAGIVRRGNFVQIDFGGACRVPPPIILHRDDVRTMDA